MQNNTQQTAVPAGYKKDARGHLVPLELIKPIDLARDDIVRELISAARTLQGNLASFKKTAFADANAFVSMSAEHYNAKVGGNKGNVTLASFDGQYKIQIAKAENVTFDERLQAAKELVDECINEWSAGSDPKIQMLVQQAFETDKEGNINTGRVLALRRLNIEDGKWQQAMTAISESVQVIGTKTYIRFYERVEDSDQYVAISLDMASV
ncbi:DUF3164 family protein [Collimonas antrihumi]|uniref:DUF3164 family protein n=1 Tax=Collimonas antrihumi TaxID=1940615 RepID=UPI001B8BB8F2|nr:DUF3164 family protein [Collimonas antrihumi]